MTENATKPDIRFGEFTDAWEQQKLEDVAEFNPKATLPDVFEYVDLESVVGTALISHRTELRESAPSRAQRLAKQGDVFFQMVRPYQKNNYLFNSPCNDYVFSTGYAQMRPSVNSHFLMSRIQDSRFIKDVLDRCTGTGYPAINSTDLASIGIGIPIDRIEQAKIGALFAAFDRLIVLHQHEYDKTINTKKAMIEKMFPKAGEDKPEIRFAGFTGAWEREKLSNLVQSFEYGLNAAAMKFDGYNKYLRITDIDENTHELKSDDLTSPDADLANSDTYKLQESDILFARTGASVGKTYRYKKSDGIVYFAGFLIRFRIKTEYDSEFVFQNTMTDRYNKFIKMASQRSGQPGVNAQEYGEYEILLPDLGEQTQIGLFFASLDRLLAHHQRELVKLQNMKRSLLEKMFV